MVLGRECAGLEQCKMLRPAYAVEYDYFPAHQCEATLQTKRVSGLFFSGQLNGTTGATASESTNRITFQPVPHHPRPHPAGCSIHHE